MWRAAPATAACSSSAVVTTVNVVVGGSSAASLVMLVLGKVCRRMHALRTQQRAAHWRRLPADAGMQVIADGRLGAGSKA